MASKNKCESCKFSAFHYGECDSMSDRTYAVCTLGDPKLVKWSWEACRDWRGETWEGRR